MSELKLAIRLELAGPVLTRSSSPGAFGVDAPAARDAEGRPILPASLVKGKLREAWDELSAIDPGTVPTNLADRWLGRANEDRRWEPDRGRLLLDDLVARTGDDPEALRHRIRIDDALGAVEPRFLQTVETPFAAGERVVFEGSAHVAADPAEAAELRRLVETGLRWVTGLGGLRSAGFGRLLGAEVALIEPDEESAAATDEATPKGTLLGLELVTDDELLISGPQTVRNLFTSLDHVPGAVLKGAIASTWNERLGRAPGEPIEPGCDPARRELAEHFASLRFTHAFPAPREAKSGRAGRPVTPPLSLFKLGREGREDAIGDALLLGEAPFLARPAAEDGEEPGDFDTPAFRPDWKDAADVDALFGWHRPARRLRVRTAIDRATRRAADDQLFAHETVSGRETRWLGRVDLSRVPGEAQQAVAGQLASLLRSEIRHLGKTQARALLHLANEGEPSDAVARQEGRHGEELRAVTLQTPALLVAPEHLAPGADLRAAYEACWRELLRGESGDDASEEVELATFFARQELAGGVYLHRRFRPEAAYEPYPLTSAGSVFLLRLPAEGRAALAERLERLAARGLPLPSWAVERYRGAGLPGDDWRRCPYVPENGYGEIALDLATHWDRKPHADDVLPIDSAEVQR